VQPIQVWPLLPPIKATVTEHPAYRSALAEIVERYGIGRILISSLIGHSLDALDAKIPTLVVCHDYYPFCPALNITFGKICTACDGGRLEACTRENPHHRFFLNLPPAAWLDVRRAFLERIQSASVPMIAPSPSVRNHYIELEPGLSSAFRVVPHGTRPMGSAPLRLTFAPDRHLRVLVLGSVAPNKGLALLEEAAPKLLEFARLLLIGCGAHGQAFEQVAGVTVVPHYRWEDLPAILGELGPDVALLPSSVPETFSYTLQELSELGIPTLATNLGSFADRIQDGSDGFLCEPTANAIVATLREIASNRGMLSPIHERLSGRPRRDVSEMVAEYEALLPAPRAAERAYFCPDSRPHRSSGGSNIAQLYWRAADETYSEERSVGAEYEVRPYRQILRLPIPPRQSTLAELRFDPSGCSGLMLLHAMRLLDGTGNAAWRWREEVASVQALRRSEILVLGEAGEGRGVLLWFEKSDPQMLLPIPPLEGVRGGVFEAELTWLGSVELPSAVAASIASGDAPLLSAAECDRLIRRQDEITPGANGGPPQAPLDALERDLAAARTRVRELENSLSWRVSAPLRGIGGLVLKLGRRGVHR
jgi:glycosyltransferase involved in cell wall biosynthesis